MNNKAEAKLPGRPSARVKPGDSLMSARLDKDLHKTLQLWADIDGCTLAEIIEKCVIPHLPMIRKKVSNHFKKMNSSRELVDSELEDVAE